MYRSLLGMCQYLWDLLVTRSFVADWLLKEEKPAKGLQYSIVDSGRKYTCPSGSSKIATTYDPTNRVFQSPFSVINDMNEFRLFLVCGDN